MNPDLPVIYTVSARTREMRDRLWNYIGTTALIMLGAVGLPLAPPVAARLQVPVCLMHMQGEPRSMQDDPHYRDVVAEVRACLPSRGPARQVGRSVKSSLPVTASYEALPEVNC